ncbi:hypothetical protein MCUN1_003116 [Malassezia cuniculi]|uniref:chitin deacetylase n=1 Tax=Malassezia cuniculi TaxID=948313 RepID=A0AAF0J7G6_9BASI|nr:hypothetical protein MCUN1_003116 [Malassezia cuniculi]
MHTKWVFGSLALASVAAAHSSFDLRVAHRALQKRGPKNAADAAKIYGINQQCQDYGDDTLYEMTQAKQFPTEGQIATIVSNDTEAKQIWNEIKSSGIIPSNVQVKQGTDGNMGIADSATSGYDKSDPDCWWSVTQCTKPKSNKIPEDFYQCDEPDTWGLTFDDGPNCSHNEFYDFLQQNKLRATLFYIGTNVIDNPYQAQRGITDGHDICVHTWSHHYMTTLSNVQVFAELYYTAKAIKAVMGITPRCWRPPFGDVDDRVRAIAAGLGLRTILWKEDTDDWSIDTGTPKSKIESNYQKIDGKANTESPIVLTHELTNNTMSMFVEQYPALKKAYKNVVPLTACLNVTNPYPEDIVYPNFEDFVGGNIDPKNKPDISTIKVDASASYKPVALSKQTDKGSYMSPGSGSASGASASSSGAGSSGTAASGSNQSDASSQNTSGASRTTAFTLHFVAVLIPMLAAGAFLS